MAIISIEGLDGVGKSTLIKAWSPHYTVIREPGGTAVGELIRSYLKGRETCVDLPHPLAARQVVDSPILADSRPVQMIVETIEEGRGQIPTFSLTAVEQAGLFNIARAEIFAAGLPPAGSVLFDRFIDSTIAYQAFGLRGSLPQISELNDLATGGLKPDLTFYLQLDENLRRQRIASRGAERDAFDYRDPEFFARVAGGFHFLQAQDPRRIKILDGRLGPNQLLAEAERVLLARGI
jgi:dTMP kinase